MKPSPVRLPAGVRDFLPRAAARRRAIAERLVARFESWGYQRIIPPVFECADVLARGLGHGALDDAIRFVEPGSGEVVALRPDFTPQVARLAATRMADAGGPVRLCYEGAVHRLAGPRGQREILQAGVELIGADAPRGDAEAVALAAAVLADVYPGADPADDVRLDVGHVAPARAVLAAAAAAGGDVHDRLAGALLRKDRAGVARAAAALPAAARPLAEALPRLWGPHDEVLAAARALPWPPEVVAALDELAAALAASRDLVAPALHARITVDLGEVRGFEYYTGLRLAGYARGAGDAVLRGGRYDGLVARYGRAAPAIGFAVDIEAIARAQRAAEIAPPAAAGVLVVAPPGDAPRLAAALRAAGVRAAADLGPAGAAAARLAYARAAGFDRVLGVAAGRAEVLAAADGAVMASGAPDEVVAALAAEGRAPRRA